jgi:hypothetical protein
MERPLPRYRTIIPSSSNNNGSDLSVALHDVGGRAVIFVAKCISPPAAKSRSRTSLRS